MPLILRRFKQALLLCDDKSAVTRFVPDRFHRLVSCGSRSVAMLGTEALRPGQD